MVEVRHTAGIGQILPADYAGLVGVIHVLGAFGRPGSIPGWPKAGYGDWFRMRRIREEAGRIISYL